MNKDQVGGWPAREFFFINQPVTEACPLRRGFRRVGAGNLDAFAPQS